MKKYIGAVIALGLIGTIWGIYHNMRQPKLEYKYDYFQSMDVDCKYHYNAIKGLQFNFPQFKHWQDIKSIKVFYNKKEITNIKIDMINKRSYYPNIFGEKEHYEQIIIENSQFNPRFKLFFYPYNYYALTQLPDVNLNFEFLDSNNNIIKTANLDYDLMHFNSKIVFPDKFNIIKKDKLITVASNTNVPYHMVLQWKYNLDDYFEHESRGESVQNTIKQDFESTPRYLGALLYTHHGDISFEYKIQLWNNKETEVCFSNDFQTKLINGYS